MTKALLKSKAKKPSAGKKLKVIAVPAKKKATKKVTKSAWVANVRDDGLDIPSSCGPKTSSTYKRPDYFFNAALFVSPEGRVYDVRCDNAVSGLDGSHEEFARHVLKTSGEKPSFEAFGMSKGTGHDFGPYECELIQRGWVRVRECEFTVRVPRNSKDKKETMWNVFIGAKVIGCDNPFQTKHITIEQLDPEEGFTANEQFYDVDALATSLEGIRKHSKKVTCKGNKCLDRLLKRFRKSI